MASTPGDRQLSIARLGGATQILFALIIGGIPFATGDSSPDFLPRGIVLAALFSLPGIVGLIGTRARRPELLLGAAGASTVGSIIAFSGVTLIFLVPAAMLVIGAARMARSRTVESSVKPRGKVAAAAIGVAGFALIVGAGVSGLFVTDSRCWISYPTANGPRFETASFPAGEISVPAGAQSGGCADGVISARGVGLAALFGGSAIGVALLVSRGRKGDAAGIARPALSA